MPKHNRSKEGCVDYLIRNIPEDVYKAAREAASKQGLSFKAWLMTKMLAEVTKNDD